MYKCCKINKKIKFYPYYEMLRAFLEDREKNHSILVYYIFHQIVFIWIMLDKALFYKNNEAAVLSSWWIFTSYRLFLPHVISPFYTCK